MQPRWVQWAACSGTNMERLWYRQAISGGGAYNKQGPLFTGYIWQR